MSSSSFVYFAVTRKADTLMSKDLNPARIMQIGMGFWASKTLLSAVELGLFTALGEGPLTGPQIRERLGLHTRPLYDFLDALLALGMLERDGDGPPARYRNSAETARFLDKRSPAYIGGLLEMASVRLFRHWSHLTTALQTGLPQSEAKDGAAGFFEAVYSDERRLEQFIAGMQGGQFGNFQALLENVDLSRCKVLADIGGAGAMFSILAARKYPDLRCVSFDLPPVLPLARRNVEQAGLGDRIQLVAGNFFEDPLPTADVITMGNILHDWDETKKRLLIARAHAALAPRGRFIAIENVIDDDRRENVFGLLMSLNMLIELEGGFDYTGAQFDAWSRAAGFARTEVVPLAGACSAAIAYK
jgi:O-methyltransferase domain/Dimerisation domain